MKTIDTFWEWVDARMQELGITSYRQLESRAGLSNGAVSSRRNELKAPTVEMADALCKALRVSWSELWWHAGYVSKIEDLTSTDPLLREAYQILQQLPEDARTIVVHMLRGLVNTDPQPSQISSRGEGVIEHQHEGAPNTRAQPPPLSLTSDQRFELIDGLICALCPADAENRSEKLQWLANVFAIQAALNVEENSDTERSKQLAAVLDYLSESRSNLRSQPD